MAERDYSTSREDRPPFREFHITEHNKTPSWKTYGDGRTTLRLQTHENAGWLSIDLTEVSYGNGPGARTVAKAAYMTLDREHAQLMVSWLQRFVAAGDRGEIRALAAQRKGEQ